MPYLQQQALFEPMYPAGWHHYWKSSFLRALDDGAIDALIEHATAKPHPMAHAVVEHVHGAARNPREDTAFAHRDQAYNLLIIGMSPEARDASALTRWARGFWQAMQAHSAGRAYVNYLMEDDRDRAAEAYGPLHRRLVALKDKYDPTNLFRVNQDISPSAAAVPGAAALGSTP